MAAQAGRADRGDGRVFQPRYRDRATGEWRSSPTWWIQYYQRGANGRAEQVRENSHSTKKAEAKNLLRDRLAEVRQYGRPIGRDAERTTFADLKAMLLDDYQVHGRRSLKRATISVAHLHESFGRSRAVDITADRVTAYIRDRQAAQAKPATIQKELAALKRMFTLAIQARRLTPAHRPYIPQLKIQNTRSGFFEEPEFRAVLAQPPRGPEARRGVHVSDRLADRRGAHAGMAPGRLQGQHRPPRSRHHQERRGPNFSFRRAAGVGDAPPVSARARRNS